MLDTSYTASGLTSDDEPVQITQTPIFGLWQIAGWDGFETAVAAPLKTLGLTLPADYKTVAKAADVKLWFIAPDRVLIQTERAQQSSEHLVALDLSDARIQLNISGAGATGILMRTVPIDLSFAALPIGTFAQTGLHHIGILIERLAENTYTLLIPRSWAETVFEVLILHLHSQTGAAQTGSVP
jgi:heterotetrameric sarcosine oxidase gamma subunit